MPPGRPGPCSDGAAAPKGDGSRGAATTYRPSAQPSERRTSSRSSVPDRPAATAPRHPPTASALAEPKAAPPPSAPPSAATGGPDAVDQKVRSDLRRCSDAPSRAGSVDPCRKGSPPRRASAHPAHAPRPASAAPRRHHGSAPQFAAAPSPTNPSARLQPPQASSPPSIESEG